MEIEPDQLVHQICFWPINAASNFKIEGKIAGLADWLKILANRLEELSANFFVDRELRIEFELAVERDRTSRGKAHVGRAQDQLVDSNESGADVVFCLGLLETKLSQLFDLEDLPNRDQQAVLLNASIPQRNLAVAGQRVRIGRFS